MTTQITFDGSKLDWEKQQNLIPAVVQNHLTGKVLMLGYMDPAALAKTLETGKVTFFSRSKQRLWTKGETSGNTLDLVAIDQDCDKDSLLVQVIPNGPTCHTGTESCWEDGNAHSFIDNLTNVIISRKGQSAESSYTASLFERGTKRIAQKVGEEGLETALAAATNDKEELINEASDLMYHLIVLLEDQKLSMAQVNQNLMLRHLNSK
ncbi:MULTISPECIES: bifunctional phosphoribosyl-AMP cyclohydrolase/phosphoribosyl-ATP diphosphatase HisIE [unclassified Shewanella]|uniref:bifunctional phosphoribosyl-AMP cyclohydrolase/phosphoribosyl-ATP diphosphatase HisIE n=1 Tax=unclassified Shewanella TaxID=196818 RepID=UPI000C83AF76|nr:MULTISPECIES: bifunctional phosphoribosyl-AMP cyclohydrolase/phosphoribosyl-ATP diphosphatase HisIE [unclassified Shewanella]MDO6678976.1 bifunctional phosphoribosyl-AMP cyclohydrolase/phosphoribosyl-ATP diphosphatase HisIE [Shewanella sp. 4_MG-2023]PMG28675.1 bifunctional phosphoribosyl-AMP cyclohydrolase/phosphoribosyl-ATP diphosphatase [Shewanella sp. 10N.286.52.C2]PMG48596.1 bifunctional phosphoribosyl-AMP cyclohydrolase/phosphoribosyl-ATP diphosphatase [Shewanella sp. 10N.286.52.B9]PMH9